MEDNGELEYRIEQFAQTTGLSPQRARVLALLKAHKSKDEIADMLDVTQRTVQNHIQDIRAEVKAAQELYDMAGPTHYDDDDYHKEFGGPLWEKRSCITYRVNETTHIEKKVYGSYYGSVLLVTRKYEQQQGTLTETRTRTEFYDGNDIPPHLFRENKFDDAVIALLHIALVAGAGIDPVYGPNEITNDSITIDDSWLIIEQVIEPDGCVSDTDVKDAL